MSFEENSIRVTIPFNFVHQPEVRDKARDKVRDTLNQTQEKMPELIRDNPSITQSRLMVKLRLGDTAVQNNISFLKKNGYIKRVGSNKKGYWEVLK